MPERKWPKPVKPDFAVRLQALQYEAFECGLCVTGHAIHGAVKALGWEQAGDVIQAGKAARETHSDA